MLYRHGIDEVDIVGLEQGASLGAVLPRVLRGMGGAVVRSATLIEPPNAVKRSEQDLLNELRSFPCVSAMKDIFDVHDLKKLRRDFPQTSRLSIRQSLPRAAMLSEFNNAQDDPVSRAFLKGPARGGFAEDLALTGADHPTVIARGRRSVVCPSLSLG